MTNENCIMQILLSHVALYFQEIDDMPVLTNVMNTLATCKKSVRFILTFRDNGNRLGFRNETLNLVKPGFKMLVFNEEQ